MTEQPFNPAEFEAFKAWQAEQKSNEEAAAEAAKPPEFYTHLADGRVLVLPEAESNSSHVDGVAVVNRYQVGA